MHLRSCPVDHSFLSVSLSLCSCCHNWRILSSYRTGQRICSDFHIRTAAGCRRFADLGSCTLSALFSQLPASPNSLLLLLPSPSSCCCCVGFVYQHTNLVGALTPSKHARIVAGEKRTCSGGRERGRYRRRERGSNWAVAWMDSMSMFHVLCA